MSNTTYIHYGTTEFSKERVKLFRNCEMPLTKPIGGFWASRTDAKFGWKDWCKENDFGDCSEDKAIIFHLSENARVLEIHSEKELSIISEKYKREFDPGFVISSWVCLDFEKIAKDYDAVEIFISECNELYWKFYGWDCDSIVILNPDVIE